MLKKRYLLNGLFFLSIFILGAFDAWSQCGGIMEPGFAFLTSSKGCAPFTVNIQTLYLSSVPGTKYFVDWGDGTPEQTYTQVGATGVNITHPYPNTSITCGYDVVIDAENACNPRGSVVPINTQVVVWTNDVISISPVVYRVCQGYAATVLFTDNSDWNCFPRATRENNEPRWIQWMYGTGPLANQIGGAKVNSITPGSFPYLDPAPFRNPIYPVTSPGQVSLPIDVPITAIADIGKEFEVALKNWNQCNPYDNNLLDGNAFNPVGGDVVNGDNSPQITTARIVIVDAPKPDFLTRLGTAAGPVQSFFCVGDDIYFDNETPPIGGASFRYTWEFFDNSTGAGAPLTTSNSTNPIRGYSTSGQKLIRLSVKDQNAAGNCVASIDKVITISPSLIAKIGIVDLSNNPITPYFCQNSSAPLTTFVARLIDLSSGMATPTTQWRWEFYDETNALIRQEPTGGGFSTTLLGPFDLNFIDRGIYRVKLVIQDNVTSCETTDEVQIRVYENPAPLFTASRVCEGQLTTFLEASTLTSINGEIIISKEWDFNYDGVTFTKDPVFDNQGSFTRSLGTSGTHLVALRVTTNQNSCSAILSLPVVVDPLPNATFVPDVISGCSILKVNFTNTSVTGQPDVIDRFVWEIDEKQGSGFTIAETQFPGAPGFIPSFTRNFENITTSNRQFDVRLRVITSHTCERISPVTTITVFPGTQSGFISTNYSPFNSNCSPQTVNFAVDAQTQSLKPTDYRWRVSDANAVISETSSGVVPAFSYKFSNQTQSLQDFFISLVTTLPSGCYGDSTRTIRISPVPGSDFTIDTLTYDCDRMKIKVSAVQKGLMEYSWEIKENNVTVLKSVSSDFVDYEVVRQAPSGTDITLAISLYTKNFANCISGTTAKNIVVPKHDGINSSFTVTPKSQSLPGSTVSLVNNTTSGSWSYLWDFGDGATSTAKDPISHSYSTFGNFVITLTVKTSTCLAVSSDRITILAVPPIIDFTYSPPFGCVPLTVKFTNLTAYGDPDKFVWEFGDGQAMSNAVDPSYTYFEPGKYSVTLSATNATGQTRSVTKQMIIEAYPVPDAQFDIKPKLVYAPDGIMYTSNKSFGATRYEWNFGDGVTSTLSEPQHSYKNEGFYDIELVAENEFGCVDTASLVNAVKVVNGGQLLIPNAFSPNLSGPSSGTSQGSGKNDIFLPLMRGVVEFEMLIFNRWGTLLFDSTDAEKGWDGYYNGKLCQQDVYVYKLSASFANGEKIVRVGDINLIR